MNDDQVTFGYKLVGSAEKKRLVQEQFDPIARTYDLADSVLSFGLDSLWRRKAIRLLGLERGNLVLDVCGGTAGLARLAARRIGPDGRAFVYDFNRPMMEVGRLRIGAGRNGHPVVFLQGDAEEMGFPDRTFDAVTMGFGLRNLAHPEQGLRETLRILRPGGKMMILEFSIPVNAVLRRLYHYYSFYWMPFAGRLVCGTSGPFRYLAESIRVFPSPEDLAGRIRDTGFSDVRFLRLSDGIAVIYLATKPGPAAGPTPFRSGPHDR